jgi:alpha-1,3-mannosyltransferase
MKAFKTEVPNGTQFVTILMLIMSRRVHSIFLLRCFNDGVAMTLAYLSIYFLQNTDIVFTLIFYT